MKYSIKDFDKKVQHIYQNDNQVVTHLNIKATKDSKLMVIKSDLK